MTLGVVALFRRPLVHGPGTRGTNSPTFSELLGAGSVGSGIVLFGVRYSDGTTLRNLDDRSGEGRLRSLRWDSGAVRGSQEFGAPLPPPGDMEVWVAWPAAGIPETRTILDGTQVAGIAAELAPLWHLGRCVATWTCPRSPWVQWRLVRYQEQNPRSGWSTPEWPNAARPCDQTLRCVRPNGDGDC